MPCRRGDASLSPDEVASSMHRLPDWTLATSGLAIERRYVFRNFADAFGLVSKIAAIAEAQDHHPDIGLGWGYVTIRLHTHAIGGLHRNDFIVAARIEQAHARIVEIGS